jgi:N-(2-amino-2-carboxyethyl)-L-glutamate synthase
MTLRERIHTIQNSLRPTPVMKLDFEPINLFAKLEFHNPIGSVKDRSALWMLKRAEERGELTEHSTLIESSSGNFANALASSCRRLGLKFIPVIDPNITGSYESNLHQLCDTVVKVEERDDTGGFLKTRLAKVQELVRTIPDAYWTNQYGNVDAMEAHYLMTGGEIRDAFSQLDYIFLGVSTAGTISGVSRRRFPSIQVIAVDTVGSIIFGGPPKKRHIPGIGSSITPDLLKHALIDDVVMVPECDAVESCQELLERYGLFVGGSSGSAYAAVKRYLPRMPVARAHPTSSFSARTGARPTSTPQKSCGSVQSKSSSRQFSREFNLSPSLVMRSWRASTSVRPSPASPSGVPLAFFTHTLAIARKPPEPSSRTLILYLVHGIPRMSRISKTLTTREMLAAPCRSIALQSI